MPQDKLQAGDQLSNERKRGVIPKRCGHCGAARQRLARGAGRLRRTIDLPNITMLMRIVRCLSIRMQGHDNSNFHTPSAALTLHLQSCEIVSESFRLP